MFIIDVHNQDSFVAKFAFEQKLVDAIKGLPNRSFDKKIGAWVFPIVDLFILKKISKQIDVELKITPEANRQYMELADELAKLKQISDAKDTVHTVDGLSGEVKLYDFQKVGIHFLDTVQSGLMGYDMGLGKSLCIDAKLLTPSGWIRMGDIAVGDEVFGSDGHAHKVVGVFPQGSIDCYDVEFTDGAKVQCSDDHLWNIQSSVHKYRKNGFVTRKLSDFRNDINKKPKGSKWFIPMIEPVEFAAKQQPIDAYILGCLIGDGSLHHRHNRQIFLTTSDKFIANEFSKILTGKCSIRSYGNYCYGIVSVNKFEFDIIEEIDKLHLNKLSYQKFIPDIYKYGSVAQRISILQGLMDTDGGVENSSVARFTTTSEALASDVQFLVESLGGKAKITSRQMIAVYKNKKIKRRISYRLSISLPPTLMPFRLPRKLKGLKLRTKNKEPYRGFKSVKYIGKKECQCISVDSSDHLYTTDHCILTHNTPIGIAVSSNAIVRHGAKRVLVVVPASMKYQWGVQIAKFSNYSYTMVAGKEREELYHKNTNFIIVNYDLLWRDIELIKDIEWDLVICDEIQRARNFRTDTFKALNQLNCKRRIGLTGTPIENDLMDLFTIMKFLNPKVFGTNPFPFINRYCTLDFFGRIDHSKYKNLEEINKKLSYSMIRRKKRDVLDELPEKTVNHIYVNLGDAERKKYKEIKNGILEDIKTGKIKSIAALAQTVYLRQLCDCLNLVVEKDKIVSSKLDELKQILAELPVDSKIIIFTQFERMAKIIEDNIGMKSVHLHGGVPSDCRWEREIEKDVLKNNTKMKQRDLDVLVYEEKLKSKCANCPYYNDDAKCNTRKKIQAKFENEKDIRVFISTNAGASGLDLQVANVLINYDMSFNPAVNEQRIARIDRMGQKSEKILIINLICIDTIEEKVLKILEKKQKLFDDVIDGQLDEAILEKLIMNTDNIKDLI